MDPGPPTVKAIHSEHIVTWESKEPITENTAMQTDDASEVTGEDQATGTTNTTSDTAEAVLERKNLGTNGPELESTTAETARQEGEEDETMK